MTPPAPRRVAVWRDDWLPPSETFIRDQIAALRRWEPVRVAIRREPHPLVEPDCASLGDGGMRASLAVRRRVPLPLRHGALRLGRIEAHLRDAGAELVHAHFGTGAITAAMATDTMRLPLVVTCHGSDVTTRLTGSVAGRAYRRRLAWAFDRATALIGVSSYICDRMISAGADPERVVRMPIGVPIVPVQAVDRSREGICFVGRLVERKGAADLLRAVAGLPEPHRSAPVTIVGDGPLRPKLQEEAARLRLRVSFAGRRPSTEIPSILRRHRVFVAPSRAAANGGAEGLGIVFLEAGLQELPSVSYRIGGIPEAVDDGVTGLLAEEGDLAGLGTRIGHLLAEPTAADAMGRAARARIVNQFDIEDRTAELEDLYDRLAADR